MKMKIRLSISLVLLLTLTIILVLTGCGMSQTEKQALTVISDIPLPTVGYSTITGHKLHLSEPESPLLRGWRLGSSILIPR